MSKTQAVCAIQSVIIGGITFFILKTTWIPTEVKIMMSFTGGLGIGMSSQLKYRNVIADQRTIDRVATSLNNKLSKQKSVTVVRLLTLLEEIKEED